MKNSFIVGLTATLILGSTIFIGSAFARTHNSESNHNGKIFKFNHKESYHSKHNGKVFKKGGHEAIYHARYDGNGMYNNSRHNGNYYGSMMHAKGGHSGIIRIIRSISTDKQRESISKIIENQRKEMLEVRKNMAIADNVFAQGKFDKDNFIDMMKEKANSQISLQAETISKIYNLLNDTQKDKVKKRIKAREQYLKSINS